MARDFASDHQKLRQASLAQVSRALNLKPANWTSTQKQALDNWSLVLALIPDLAHWTSAEKRQLLKIIRAKSAPTELPYLRQTQGHSRLRAELLRLGSK
jgi:hypothetical protein